METNSVARTVAASVAVIGVMALLDLALDEALSPGHERTKATEIDSLITDRESLVSPDTIQECY